MSAPDPVLSLQRAIQSAISTDADLIALIGARLFDRVPDRARHPYATHGTAESSPVDGEGTVEHLVTLEAWSRARGRREALAVLAGLRRALRAIDPALDGHRLVSLREVASTVPPGGGGVQRATITFRAVTEPAA